MTGGGLSAALVGELRTRLGGGGVVTEPGRLLSYESDALPRFRQLPLAVILPRDTDEAAWAVRLLAEAEVPLTPRGAGTGLSGGGVAAPGGVVVGTSRMNRILSLDPDRRLARVQAGVVNADLSIAAAPFALHYAPDPSSQTACTLGGNVGENAGGPHCLKYGVTTRYVTGLTVVTGGGEVLELGGAPRAESLDLVGLFVGSEGRMGLATELELRLIPRPRAVRTFLAVFGSTEEAGGAVSAIIADGLLPAAMEIMDRGTIRAVEASVFAAGYPTNAGAVLVVEFDGTEAGLDADAERAQAHCLAAGATEVRRARNEAERSALWQGRKKAYGAFGRLTPDLMVQDATVPRSVLPQVLHRIEEIGRRHELVLANVFHAGDGNLHPKILFDRRDAETVERVERASKEIMQVCVEAGGTITGEHGVGLDKRGYMHLVHGPAELRLMAEVQAAFDPLGIWNPGKVLPDGAEKGDSGAPRGQVESAPLVPGGYLAPDSVPGIQECLARASIAGMRVRVSGRVGGGVEVSSGQRVTGSQVDGVVVSAGGLPPLLDHAPQDLTVTVSASVPVADLQGALARAGQWLPMDVPGMERWSVGSLVARGAWGPLAPSFGRVRDLLLGAQLVTGDGRRVRLGGRVMKNVAGFDLVRGVAGSRGRWGVTTEATFRLYPIPGRHRVLTWEDGAGEIRTLARRLSSHPILPAALVRVGQGASQRLLVRLLGSDATVQAESEELERDFPGAEAWEEGPHRAGFVGGDPLAAAVAGEASGPLLEIRPGEFSWDLLEARLAGLLGEHAEFHHLSLWDVWRVPVPVDASPGTGDGWSGALGSLADEVRRAGGEVILLRGLGIPAWSPLVGDGARALVDSVCAVFDPAGILGRWAGEEGSAGWT